MGVRVDVALGDGVAVRVAVGPESVAVGDGPPGLENEMVLTGAVWPIW